MSPTVTMLNENARAFTYPRVPQCHHIEGSDSYDPNTSSMVTSTLKMRMDFPFNFLYFPYFLYNFPYFSYSAGGGGHKSNT